MGWRIGRRRKDESRPAGEEVVSEDGWVDVSGRKLWVWIGGARRYSRSGM